MYEPIEATEEIPAVCGPQAGLRRCDPSYNSAAPERQRGSLAVAVETALVAIGVIAAIRALNSRHVPDFQWLAVACLLVGAALLPTWLRGDAFPNIGLDPRNVLKSASLVCITGLCLVPAAFTGLWLAARMHLPLPPSPGPAAAGLQGWLAWVFHQFLYVAVAEEVFFRGYLQSNVARLLAAHPIPRRFDPWVIAAVSAGCFAAAHAIVQGQIIALVTFLPGLVLAWLFIRARTLLAPILFHGLANISFGLFALLWMD